MIENINSDFQKSMDDLFGHDTLVSIATIYDNIPYVRVMDSYYEDGVFYSITFTNSNKMKHIKENPKVAICSKWLSAHGIAENLGHPCDEKNVEIASKLRTVFNEWYNERFDCDNNPNACILAVRLTDAKLLHDDSEFVIDFEEK